MYIGFFAIGFFAAFTFTAVIPAILETMVIEEKKKCAENGIEFISNNEELGDKACGLFNVAYALGGMVSPVLGGALYDKVQF